MLEHETVAVRDALGRALAAPVRSERTLPPADCSAMDGYAVRSDDLRQAIVIALLGEPRRQHLRRRALDAEAALRRDAEVPREERLWMEPNPLMRITSNIS